MHKLELEAADGAPLGPLGLQRPGSAYVRN
jgi:hypothetical protein